MTEGHQCCSTDMGMLGKHMYEFIAELYPICRSMTGEGVRETLRLIGRHIPLAIHEVPSGTRVFDWTVPLEWNIRDAYICNSKGKRIVDFRRLNLHVGEEIQPLPPNLSFEGRMQSRKGSHRVPALRSQIIEDQFALLIQHPAILFCFLREARLQAFKAALEFDELFNQPANIQLIERLAVSPQAHSFQQRVILGIIRE